MNVSDFLVGPQAQHDETTARASELRGLIAHVTAALPETETRLAHLATTAKVVAELAPAGGDLDPSETNTPYQAIVNACNQHPDQVFRARELQEILEMPTDEASVNITRSRLGRLTRQPSSPSPDKAAARNGLNVH
ncbi:hypothetical protein ACIQY8_31225 [Streptomyces albidoflavus]